MNEKSGTTLATGWWCDTCEFFETLDDINETKDTCDSCGCDGSAHVAVEVVAK